MTIYLDVKIQLHFYFDTMPCYRPNLVTFVPDHNSYNIDSTSTTGWYVLYPRQIISNPVLVYIEQGDTNYYGWSTVPNQDCDNPLTAITTGKCLLVYQSVEDAVNTDYGTEESNGMGREQQYGNGRFVLPKLYTIDDTRQYFSLYTQYDFYDISQIRFNKDYIGVTGNDVYPTPNDFIGYKAVLADTRHRTVPTSRLGLNKSFGSPVNYRWSSLGVYKGNPVYYLINDVINPNYLITTTVVDNNKLEINLSTPQDLPVEFVIDFGYNILDRFTTDVVDFEYSVGNQKIYGVFNPGQIVLTISAVLPLRSQYTPVLKANGQPDMVLNWLV